LKSGKLKGMVMFWADTTPKRAATTMINAYITSEDVGRFIEAKIGPAPAATMAKCSCGQTRVFYSRYASLRSLDQNSFQGGNIMVRGIAWDNLPNRYVPGDGMPKKVEAKTTSEEVVPHKFEFSRDIPDIARRTAFGLVVR
jgi:hypothetical protein